MSNQESTAKKSKVQISERRRFFSLMAQSIGATALAGFVWGAYVEEAKASPLVLRPPGARPERDFLAMCIKCGQCAEACRHRDSNPDRTHRTATLQIAKPGDHFPIGTPYFIPRQTPCYMCEDIPCVPVCPTGALDEGLVSFVQNGTRKMDINKARMGVAVVDPNSCIAYWGLQCDACYRACPLLKEAITLELRRNERTGKHAFLIPIVHADVCTGCGLCEHACVTEKAAIYVLPREVALGKAGDRYVKGWEKENVEQMKNISTKTQTETERSKKKPTEYLNEGVSYE